MKKPTLLIDLDCTLVDMLPPWLNRYNEIKGTDIKLDDIKDYDVGLVCFDEEVLYGILTESGFFLDMEPMPGAVSCLQNLIDEGYDVVIVTQPPRRAEFAVRDKRLWVQKFFPDFDLKNMIFCHRKDMIRGDLLFDDNPSHIVEWQKVNPDKLTATLDWKFSATHTNFRGSLEDGWKTFNQFVKKSLPLS